MSFPASSELVAVAWLQGVPGFDSSDVGQTLPEDNSTWSACGYTQMVAVVGGTPGMYVPQRQPIVQIDLWAVAPDSGQPAWGKARNLAELVIADTYPSGARVVNLPANYRDARVQAVWPETEPRRIPGDAGSYAHYTLDLGIAWVEIPD